MVCQQPAKKLLDYLITKLVAKELAILVLQRSYYVDIPT